MFSSGEQTFQGNWLEAVMAPPGSGCPVGAPQYALFGAWGAAGLPFPLSVYSLPTPTTFWVITRVAPSHPSPVLLLRCLAYGLFSTSSTIRKDPIRCVFLRYVPTSTQHTPAMQEPIPPGACTRSPRAPRRPAMLPTGEAPRHIARPGETGS